MRRFTTIDAPLPAEKFRESLGSLGMNQSEFARWIRKNPRTIRLWAAGRYPVPIEIGYLLTLMLLTDTKPGG